MVPTYHLDILDLFIIGLYGVFIIGAGIRFMKEHETADDYFLAGRSMGWPLIGLSLFASNISSTTLIGLSGDAYKTGISVFNYEWMAVIALIFFVFFVLPFYLKSKIYTVPEFLEKRFDGRIRKYFSILTIFLNIIVDTAGSLYAGALLFKLIYPKVPIWQTIGIIALISGLYTVAGGLRAVIHTDTIQAILLVIGSVILTINGLERIGGWKALVNNTAPEMLSLIRPLGDPAVPWMGLITGIPILGFYFWCTNQFMVQRALSAKNLQHGRFGALFAGLLKLPVLFIMVIPGTIALQLYPNLTRPDMVYPTLLFDLLPKGILGVVLAGFLAALMSQIDSTLNSASTLVTMDFVKKWKPNLSSKNLMVIGRIVTILFMLLAALWAPQIQNFTSLFRYLQRVLSYAVSPVVAIFLLGIFWKRANAQGAFYATLLGTSAGAVLFVINEIFKWTHLHFLYVAPLLLGISSVILVLVSLRTTPPLPARIDDFTWSKEFYKNESIQLQHIPIYKNYRFLSVIIVILTAIILYFFW